MSNELDDAIRLIPENEIALSINVLSKDGLKGVECQLRKEALLDLNTIMAAIRPHMAMFHHVLDGWHYKVIVLAK